MTLQSWLVYVLGFAIVALGTLLAGHQTHSVRARDVRGSVVAGEVNESVTIRNIETDTNRHDGHGDRIGWLIAVIGVLIAAAQFAQDVFRFLK